MRRFLERFSSDDACTSSLTLPFDRRQRSRQRVALDDGEEVLLDLPRGTVLRNGDKLRGEDGTVVQVRAAAEEVSVATSPSSVLLARAAYHLGNRHVPLQIEARHLIFAHDHVLDAMVRELGLSVEFAAREFEPEAGAYSDLTAHAPHQH